jgi:hypothetical protein
MTLPEMQWFDLPELVEVQLLLLIPKAEGKLHPARSRHHGSLLYQQKHKR